MAVIEINRLALQLSGISEHEGSVLAWKIREALAATTFTSAAGARIAHLKIGVEKQPGEDMDILGKRVVADLLSQIARSG